MDHHVHSLDNVIFRFQQAYRIQNKNSNIIVTMMYFDTNKYVGNEFNKNKFISFKNLEALCNYIFNNYYKLSPEEHQYVRDSLGGNYTTIFIINPQWPNKIGFYKLNKPHFIFASAEETLKFRECMVRLVTSGKLYPVSPKPLTMTSGLMNV